ncbi:MAG: hypothetical protein ACPG4T_03195 [Nannocystaceae bacterium]
MKVAKAVTGTSSTGAEQASATSTNGHPARTPVNRLWRCFGFDFGMQPVACVPEVRRQCTQYRRLHLYRYRFSRLAYRQPLNRDRVAAPTGSLSIDKRALHHRPRIPLRNVNRHRSSTAQRLERFLRIKASRSGWRKRGNFNPEVELANHEEKTVNGSRRRQPELNAAASIFPSASTP